MKQCLRCFSTYDDQLNFCLNDGEPLVRDDVRVDESPTVVLDNARMTNPTGWPSPPSTYAPPAVWQPNNMQGRHFAPNYPATKDKTLPIIALVLGLLSFPFSCCLGGVWLGIPAAVVGYLAMRNTSRDPERYEGRGMAIAGLLLGLAGFLISFIFLLTRL